MTDLGDLIAEVSSQVLHVVLLYLQQGCHLSIVVGIGLLGVEGDDITRLGTVEELLLVLSLDIGRHDHTTLSGDTAFLGVTVLVELTQVTSEGIVTAEDVGLHELTCLRGVHLYLIVDQLVLHLDGVVVDLVLGAELSLELRGNGDIEHESQIGVLLEVLGHLLLLVGKGLAQHLDIVLLDVFVQLLTEELVHFLYLNGCSILLLNHTHRNHTWTETRHLCLLTIILQGLLYRFLVVCRLNGHRQQTIDLIGAIK